MKTEMIQHKNKRQPAGAILPLVIVLILLLALASISVLSLGQASQIRTIRHNTELEARAAADAGIERILFLMNQQLADGLWDPAELPV